MDREKVIKEYEDYVNSYISLATSYDYEFEMHKAVLAILKEQEELLRKLQNVKDKLCLEVSKWKHKFHDAPPKFVSQGVVDQICWERDTALSQLEQIGKGLGSKMDDIVALLKEQEAVEPKAGHWIESKCLDECFWVCSECNFQSEAIATPKLYKFCPNCGIKMEGQAVKWNEEVKPDA